MYRQYSCMDFMHRPRTAASAGGLSSDKRCDTQAMASPDDRPLRLTQREAEVIGHIADGQSERRAAELMNVSRWTYRRHKASVVHKVRGEADRQAAMG